MKKNDPVQIIPIFSKKSNSFLIRNSTNCMLIDTGIPGQISCFLNVFDQYKINPTDLELIIITHTHNDHCGNVAELKTLTGAKIMVHAVEAENLEKGFTPFPLGTSFLPKLISKLANRSRGSKQQYNPVTPDITIKDEFDLEEFGFEGYVLPTPGHTNGSLCVILKNEVAFVGDTMFNIVPGTVFPPFADNPDILKRSWYKLLESGVSLFYPGHGKAFDLKKLQRSLKKL